MEDITWTCPERPIDIDTWTCPERPIDTATDGVFHRPPNAGHQCPGCEALLHRFDKLERGHAAALELAAQRLDGLEKLTAELRVLIERVAEVVNGESDG